MPRIDRRFTAEDVSRLFCKNLDPEKQLVANRIIAACGTDEGGVPFLVSIFSAVLDVLGYVDVPFGNLLSKLIEILIDALENPTTEQQVIDALRSVEPLP